MVNIDISNHRDELTNGLIFFFILLCKTIHNIIYNKYAFIKKYSKNIT